MPEAAISFGAYERTGNPTLAAINCYAEQVPSPSGPRIQMRSRPGMEEFATAGAGPLRGIHAKDGLFGGAAHLVSGTAVYSLTSAGVLTALAGTVAGDDLVDMDSGQDADLNAQVRMATGSRLYLVQDGVVTLEAFPEVGGAGAASVCYHRGFWFAVEAGTDKLYYLVPGDPAWTPLSFASAEFSPDPLVAVRSRGDQIVLLGSSTTEVWTLTGQADPAIAPYGGLNFDFGCRSRDSAVNCRGSLIWVDNDCIVRRFDGGNAEAVSGPGLSEIIRGVSASDLRAWTFSNEAHKFYVLTIGTVATWVYDLDGAGERWTTFDSLTYDYWRTHLGCTLGSGDATLAMDNITPTIFRLDADRRTDSDDTFQVVTSFTIEGGDKDAPFANLGLLCDLGDAPLSGQGADPVVGLAISYNQGKTFTSYIEQPLGGTGEYDSPPVWNGLGTIPRFLGVVGRLRISDPVGRVFKKLFVNV